MTVSFLNVSRLIRLLSGDICQRALAVLQENDSKVIKNWLVLSPHAFLFYVLILWRQIKDMKPLYMCYSKYTEVLVLRSKPTGCGQTDKQNSSSAYMSTKALGTHMLF